MSAQVFVKLFAIFAVVAIGWAVARSGRLGSGDPSRVLAGAAFYIFVPALLFRTSARTDFARLDPRIVVAFFVPTIAVLLIVYTTLRLARGAQGGAAAPSVRAITGSFGNAVQIGIPLARVELALARARRRADPGGARLLGTLAITAKNTVVHPVVLPVLAGLAWNASGFALPTFADEILATLGQAVVPLCLVLIGVSLAHYGVRGALRGAVVLSTVKLVVQPLAVLVFARFVLGLGGVPLAIVVMMAAVPVGSNALIFSQRYGTLQAETSTAIVVSTLAFVVSAPLWLAVLHAVG
jgi:predicted permease